MQASKIEIENRLRHIERRIIELEADLLITSNRRQKDYIADLIKLNQKILLSLTDAPKNGYQH